MADESLKHIDIADQSVVLEKWVDLGDGTRAAKVAPIGSDPTAGVQRVARKLAPGTAAPISASGQAITGPAMWGSFSVVNSHATATSTISFYDNTSATGNKIYPDLVVPAVSGHVRIDQLDIPLSNGLWIVITGGTVQAMAWSGPVM